MPRDRDKSVIFGASDALCVEVHPPESPPDTRRDPRPERPSSGWRWYAGWMVGLPLALALTLAWCVALIWLVGRIVAVIGI